LIETKGKETCLVAHRSSTLNHKNKLKGKQTQSDLSRQTDMIEWVARTPNVPNHKNK